MYISPSIASADVCNIQREVEFSQKHFSHIHVDIEDGVYLNNLTFGMKTLQRICDFCTASISVHLEVNNPLSYLETLAKLPVDEVFIHLDHLNDPLAIIHRFKEKRIHVGLGYSNRDDGKNYDSILKQVDSILILSALIEDPAQKYSLEMDKKIKSFCKKGKWNVWVDGGVGSEQLPSLQERNVYAVVMGRSIFKDKNAASQFFEK